MRSLQCHLRPDRSAVDHRPIEILTDELDSGSKFRIDHTDGHTVLGADLLCRLLPVARRAHGRSNKQRYHPTSHEMIPHCQAPWRDRVHDVSAPRMTTDSRPRVQTVNAPTSCPASTMTTD